MSVGGTIVDVVEVAADRWWINTIDRADLMHGGRTCAVYCDPRPERPQVGDALWWQGGHCFWTSRVQPDGRSDVKLLKIGYSGVPHPHREKVGSRETEPREGPTDDSRSE